MDKERKIEYRFLKEIRAANDTDKMIVEGVAVRFGVANVLWTDSNGKEYKEIVAKGAFDNCVMDDVLLRYNHDDSVPVLANTKNKTLELTVTDEELRVRAELANTSVGRDVFELVKAGTVGGLSIAFYADEDDCDYMGTTRTINKVTRLIEISIVDHPAYQETSVEAVRSMERTKREKQEKRKRLILRTYL